MTKLDSNWGWASVTAVTELLREKPVQPPHDCRWRPSSAHPPPPIHWWGKGAWLHLLALLLGQGALWLTLPWLGPVHDLAQSSPNLYFHHCLVCASFACAMSSQSGHALGILALSPCLGNALPLRLRRIWTHIQGSVSVLAPVLKPSPSTQPKKISLPFERVYFVPLSFFLAF